MFTHPLHDHVLTRGFDYLSRLYVGGQHAAADYVRRTGPTRNAPIRVIADSKVVGRGWDSLSGYYVSVDHDDGWRSFYRHLFGMTPVVVGQRVVQGQIIGNVGNTGASLGDHLHFDLWNRQKQDPTAFYKNGWWAHDPKLYLGKEDDMGMTPEQEAEMQLLREQVNVMIGQIGQLLNEAALIRGAVEYLNTSEHEFRIVQGQVNQLLERPANDGLKRGDTVKLG